MSNIKIENSFKLQKHAKKRIPGLCQLLSKRPDQFSWGVWPGYYSKAKGVQVWDLDGNEYTDMSIGGIGATVLGYADDYVDNAVKNSIDKGVASSLNCPEEVILADLLCEIHPWADMCRFTRTGGEAMSVAVRIARASSKKDKVAICGYHGWHDWYLAANVGTENALGEHLLSGLNPLGVPEGLKNTALPFRYNHIEELEEIVSKYSSELGVIVMEPTRDEEPKDDFIHAVRKIADQNDIVLVIDEISAGFRMVSGGAHLKYGVTPDIAVFSKAMGNGYAIGAVIGKESVMTSAQETFISSTNWTERVGFTAAIATITKHRDVNAGEHLIELGTAVQHGWNELAEEHNLKIQIGGMKPISHFSFEYGNPLELKALFVQGMLEKGFLASTAFYAMYSHSFNDVENYLSACDRVFFEISEAISTDSVSSKLRGNPSVAGFKRLT